MSAVSALARRAGAPAATTLEEYRDDGPLARALAVLGRAVPSPPALLELAGLAPLVALAAADGADASTAALAAAIAWLVLLGGLAGGRPHRDRVRWAAPPILRVADYGGLLYIGAQGGTSAEAAAFAVVAVLTFRHYDLVYRLRHQALAPPPWVTLFGLGWDGRLVLGWALLALGALPTGYFVLAAVFAVVFVGESVAGWRRFARDGRTTLHDDDEEDIAE